jgi:hypothetical protein
MAKLKGPVAVKDDNQYGHILIPAAKFDAKKHQKFDGEVHPDVVRIYGEAPVVEFAVEQEPEKEGESAE